MNFTKPPVKEAIGYPLYQKKAIENKDFITVFMRSLNAQEIADHFGVTRQAVYSKANLLRKKGVRLPKLESHLSEVDELNKLIEKLSRS